MTTAIIKTQRVADGYHSWVAVYSLYNDDTISRKPILELAGVTHRDPNYPPAKLHAIATRWSGGTNEAAEIINPISPRTTVHLERMYTDTVNNIRQYISQGVEVKMGVVANYVRRTAYLYNKTHQTVLCDLMRTN